MRTSVYSRMPCYGEMAEDTDVTQTMSDSDSSEVSCTDVYFSEEDIVCSFVKDDTSSSDSEQDGTERKDAFPVWFLGYTERQEILTFQNGSPEGKLIICPRSARDYLSKSFPELFNSLYTLRRKGTTVAYVTPSALSDLQSKNHIRLPKPLIGDVCLFNPNDTVKLLTLVSVNSKHKGAMKYNAQAARTLSRTVTQDTSLDISIVSGVFLEEEWRSQSEFLKKVTELERIAKKVEIPDTLDMNFERHMKIITYLLSKVPADGAGCNGDEKCNNSNCETERAMRFKLEFPVRDQRDFILRGTDDQWVARYDYNIFIHVGFGSPDKKIPPTKSTPTYCDMCKRKSLTHMGLVQCTLCYEIGCQECHKYYAPRTAEGLGMGQCCVRCFRQKTSSYHGDGLHMENPAH